MIRTSANSEKLKMAVMELRELDLEEVRELSLVDRPTVWQRLGLEGKSPEERANYWKTNNATSWNACEAVYPAEMRQVFAENRSREKRWRDYTSNENAWQEQSKYSGRKTIAARLFEMQGEGGLAQVYKQVYGKSGWFDFSKKKKMQMLRRLLDCENLEEVMRSYFNYSGDEKFKMPEFKRLENYVRNYLERVEREERIEKVYRERPGSFISGRELKAAA